LSRLSQRSSKGRGYCSSPLASQDCRSSGRVLPFVIRRGSRRNGECVP
jgi:hypothetical protein